VSFWKKLFGKVVASFNPPLDNAVLNEHTQNAEDQQKKEVTLTIHGAAAAGDVVEVQNLLAAGADVNALDGSGETPLFLAACRGHAEVAKLLLQAGADPEIASPMGGTPLWQATGQGHLDVCKVLQEAGAAETKRRKPKEALTFSPANAPRMFLAVSQQFVAHLTDKLYFDESPWDYIEYDPTYLQSGMPGNNPRDYRPGQTQSSLELKTQSSGNLLQGKRHAGRPISDYSFCLAVDKGGQYWAFAQDDYGACSVDTVWNLAVTLIALSGGEGNLIPVNPSV